MPRILKSAVVLALLTSAMMIVGCGADQPMPLTENRPVAYVDADGSNPATVRDTLLRPFPHMRMADGQITLNDRCPVRKSALNLRLPGLYVNGRPIGFC